MPACSRTRGQSRFHRPTSDGTFSAYDARTLKEVWSVNVGARYQRAARSLIRSNGKQYVAVLVGSRLSAAIVATSPELKTPGAVIHAVRVRTVVRARTLDTTGRLSRQSIVRLRRTMAESKKLRRGVGWVKGALLRSIPRGYKFSYAPFCPREHGCKGRNP